MPKVKSPKTSIDRPTAGRGPALAKSTIPGPVQKSFSPLVSGGSIPAPKPKAGTRPSVHPIQRR